MQREYGEDFSHARPDLSWRRVLVLIRGLSPNSATVAALRAAREYGREPVRVLTTEEEVMASRAAIVGKGRVH